MSVDFKLSNILGTVYSQGNLLFTPDGTKLLSPVGNRVSVLDIANNSSYTFNYEHRRNVVKLALNKNATLLISVDETGRAILVNFARRTVLHHFNFKDKVSAIAFAPDGSHFAVACDRKVQVWRTPNSQDVRQFAPFVRHRVYTGHFAEIVSIEFSGDSRFFLTASKDMSAHIYSLHSADATAAGALAGHRDALVGAFFSQDQETIYTVSRDGAQFQYNYSDEEERWIITDKHYFLQQARTTCAAFHPKTNLLVVGFSSGVFGLYELPSCTRLQALNVSSNLIDCITINASGEWLALGASHLGQLLVWEWQSESYVLKQQSHYDSLNCLVYSPDGTKIITGADDGKIKVWDALSGFCILTFTQHQAAVTALAFSPRGNVLFSASLDGSVRAWDLVRYRNFRTFTAPSRLQFTSLVVDPSGELVCAGSINDYDIHVWNVQTSVLVDRLAGHEGPVSCLDFSFDGATLASVSWDHTVRLWNFFGRSALSEPMQLQSEGLVVKFAPDAKSLAVASMDGQVSIWDAKLCQQTGAIDGKKDILGGRYAADRFTSGNAARAKHFTALSYSIDGKTLVCGGNSRFVCLYDVANEVLLRKFSISKNMALDGTQDTLNSKNMTDAGPLDLIDMDGENSDLESRMDHSLPGAQKGDLSKRRVRPAIRAADIVFSPVDRSFSIASTEGLLIYSVDAKLQFDPFNLQVDVTVANCVEALSKHEFLNALIMAFRIGEHPLVLRVYQAVPEKNIELVVQHLPEIYLERLLRLIGNEGQEGPHIEFNLIWLKATLKHHGDFISRNRQKMSVSIRAAQRFLNANKTILDATQTNTYRLQLLQRLSAR